MSTVLACDLSAFGNRESQVQHENNSLSVIKSIEGIKELSEGYSFCYTYSQDKFIALSQWITMENKCCPFFTFVLRLVPDNIGTKIWLEIGGSIEIKKFIETNFENQLGIDLHMSQS